MKKNLLIGLLLAVVLVVGFYVVYGIWGSNPGALVATSKPEQPYECGVNVRMFLGYLKDGDAANEYWKPGIVPHKLYAVSDYRYLGEGFLQQAKLAFYTYEINSTTREGIPIRKRWHILLDPNAKNGDGKKCAITGIVEAEQ